MTVTAFPGTTGTPSFATPVVTVSGGLTPTVSGLTISGNTATFTVTINSTSAGTFTVTASDVVTMGGVAVTRTTGDGFTSPDGSDSTSAVKNYVDALIGITPLTPVNEVKHAEVFTVTVTAFPAATGTPSFGTPTVTVSGGLTPTVSGLTISGNTATFTVTINSTSAGTFTVTASDVVTMGGVAVTRTTGDGFTSGDGSDYAAPAVKNQRQCLDRHHAADPGQRGQARRGLHGDGDRLPGGHRHAQFRHAGRHRQRRPDPHRQRPDHLGQHGHLHRHHQQH